MTSPVQVVVANILAEVILLFVDDVYQALQPGGAYIASGIYKNKEEIVEKALIASGFEIADICREDDWVAFVARKTDYGVLDQLLFYPLEQLPFI